MTDDRLLAAKKKFSRLLKEIFQFDCADLDFGIYRILAMRRAELERFLDDELLPQVEGILAAAAGDRASVQSELSKLESTLRDAGIQDFSSSPKWNELKGKLAASPDVAALAREVFSDLTTFFARYYDEGDFMALPRYKGDTYAIPYDGSEVKLHWANADQYYIKTTEQHADYTAVIDGVSGLDKPRLRFRLAAAESDRDNNKSTEKRRYMLREESPVEVEGSQLTIWFEYRVPEPGNGRQPTQNSLCDEMEKAVLAAVPQAWQAALTRKASQSPEKYTVLGYQLYRYTRKNTSDYFIHKDLGGFLRRELDFFIKNEVIFLDDIEGRTSAQIDVALQKVKAIRAVGGKLIDWLAQIEDFQKRLYLKRKFSLRTDWYVPLSVLPAELRARLAKSEAQRGFRQQLYGFSETGSELDERLLLSTEFLDPKDKLAVQEALSNEERQPHVLVHGDNAQALRFLAGRFQGSVDCLYIDPPYNAKTSEILYKNTFKHAAWLSMMSDRLRVAECLRSPKGVCVIAIDENEQERLGLLLEVLFEGMSRTCVTIVHNPRGIQGGGFSYTHEYAYFVTPPGMKLPKRSLDSSKSKPLMKTGSVSMRHEGPTMFYPIIVKDGEVVDVGEPPDEAFHPNSPERTLPDGSVEVWPIDSKGGERKWRYKGSSLLEVKDDIEMRTGRDGRIVPYLAKDKEAYRTVWTDSKYNAAEYGSTLLKNIVPGAQFSFPKSVHTVKDCVDIACGSRRDATVFDYFAGSGTTAHAVFDLNREDGGSRRVVLAEMGEYFDHVLLPRVLRTAWVSSWQDGNPSSHDPLPDIFQVVRLEAYDDTLESLVLKRDRIPGELFESNDALREDYTLRYMLNLEAEGSLLNLDRFRKPWDYTIKVRRDGVIQDSPVDLVETFNYLIGLRVRRYDTYGQEGLLFVMGTDPEGRRVIIVWRDCDLWPNDRLEEKCRQAFESFRPDEFDLVYVNGDNHLPIIKTGEESWKVNLIEETFHARMFDTSDVE